MKWFLLLLLLIPFVFTQCRSKQTKLILVARDTTITRVNAFSELFLDSMQVESFIASRELDDSSAYLLRNFYNTRNYQFAWFTNDGLAEQASVFWNLYTQYADYAQDSILVDKQLRMEMEAYDSPDTAFKASTARIAQTELLLSQQFFNYVRHAYAGKVDPEEMKWYIPRKKVDAVALLDSLLSKKGASLDKWEPLNKPYKLMQRALVDLYQVSKNGGWDSLFIKPGDSYQEGNSGSFVAALKQRLILGGELNELDTTDVFTSSLTTAVKQAQSSFGYRQTGVVTAGLVKALNTPAKTRIEQVLINMERMRWMPEEEHEERIIVNIPEFKIHVFNDSGKAFDMDVVVGRAGNHTVVLNEALKYVVFSPYWNVPRSIVKAEILPALQKNPNYLIEKNMEQTGGSDSLPVIRQKPGGNNALGRVKFIFPNSYNIYFHDSPAKSLFKREKRDFSHGCIRLSEPRKLAAYLLRHQPEWTSERMDEAMSSDTEKWVSLRKPVPVVISYFTAWVDSAGLLNFREDIYNHDKEMAQRLFTHTPR